MPSFASFGEDDKWAVTHYVISLGHDPAEKDSSADFAAIKIDPTKEDSGSSGPKMIPIEMAMDRVVREGR
jgi:hypothetical protein